MTETMSKLRHLYVFHHESGVCIYYHPFTDAKIDPQLVAGFCYGALAASKKKIPPKKAKPELKEFEFMDHHLVAQFVGPCMFVVMVEGLASDTIRAKASQFIDHFMGKFDKDLKDWRGNVRIFKDVENDVRLVFGFTKV
jgi:hypothetical protein